MLPGAGSHPVPGVPETTPAPVKGWHAWPGARLAPGCGVLWREGHWLGRSPAESCPESVTVPIVRCHPRPQDDLRPLVQKTTFESSEVCVNPHPQPPRGACSRGRQHWVPPRPGGGAGGDSGTWGGGLCDPRRRHEEVTTLLISRTWKQAGKALESQPPGQARPSPR